MTIADLHQIDGRRFPAGRRTQNLVGGMSPIQSDLFRMGFVTLDPHGGQVPWHNHEQEEIYVVLEGRGEMCVGDEVQLLTAGQTIAIPSNLFHQLTNVGDEPLKMIYVYAPGGDVLHWKQELEGTLPRAGIEAPNVPAGATPQFMEEQA